MDRLKLSRIVIVEGKYDKIKLSALIDGMILTTDGFRIYRDKARHRMLRDLALKRGAVIVTDSDRAGFRIRGFLRSILQGADLVQVYIPQLSGKEKRKPSPGAEGLLGVEGMDLSLLEKLFRQAGALAPPETPVPPVRRITRQDFYEDGLTGGANASELRTRLLRRLGLPDYLTSKALLETINTLMTYEEYRSFLREEAGEIHRR